MSLSEAMRILASKRETVTVTVTTQDSARLAMTQALLPASIRVPRKTRNVRAAVQIANGGRIGTANLDRKIIDAAPEAPTTPAKLSPRAQDQGAPPAASAN